KANLIFGVGDGDAKAEVAAIYKKNNLTEALAKNLNSHNLYLQTQVSTGILGELSLFLLIFAPLWQRRNKQRTLGTSELSPSGLSTPQPTQLIFFWCFLFAIFGLTESLLEVQRGTLFVAFFFSLISILQEKNEP
ncbi:MAG: hypothetical protein RI894_626, partial [Bacteroidota bacterium]